MAALAKENGIECSRTKVTVVLGAQWGDEGKGKLVDLLATKMHVVARCQGGNNAGHTVVANGRTYDFHTLPSGIIHQQCTAVIGNGVVLNIPALFDEVEHNKINELPNWADRLRISDQAHLVFDFHMKVDGLQEEARKESKNMLGTTKKGIGPAYSNKCRRNGVRLCELMYNFEEFESKYKDLAKYYKNQFNDLEIDVAGQLATYKELANRMRDLGLVTDTVQYLHQALQTSPPKEILVEGANGTLLDIDFGTYPYVTSSNCSVGGACTGLGLPPHCIGSVIGIVKAYQTRVGAGPFPSEQEHTPIGQRLRDLGGEYGVTTGRPRRCGWLDLVLLKRSLMINGFTAFALTKLDVLDSFEAIEIAVAYKLDGKTLDTSPSSNANLDRVEVVYESLPGWKCETKNARQWSDLPENARNYVSFIEKYTGVIVKWIGVGQDRNALVTKEKMCRSMY